MAAMTRSLVRLIVLALTAWSALAAGCDSRPRGVTDAGPGRDSGPPTDSGPMDAGPPPIVCVGTPTACAALPTAPECATVQGCAFSQCAGFAVACERNPSQASCVAELGCVWSGTACTGVARECGTFLDMPTCQPQPGCTWSTRAQCRGTATACTALPDATCELQPGCLVNRPDAGPPDAGPPDAGCMSGAIGSTTLVIHTVTAAMGGGTSDLGSVAVRAEGPCAGTAIEMSTDASGDLSLDLPNAGAPWAITFAHAGYSAVSIMDVTNIGFGGDVRLDRVTVPVYAEYSASGTVGGSIGIGNVVQVDTFDFGATIAGGGGVWSSTFDLAPAPNPAPPLTFVALELDATGRALNFASSTARSRTTTPVSGVALVMPSPAATVTETRIVYHLPTSGIAVASSPLVSFDVTHALMDLAQFPYAIAGSQTIETGATAGDVTQVIRHFGGELDANFAGFQIQGVSGIINVIATDLTDHEVTVPPIDSLGISGTSLGGLGASASGSGYDVLIIHIGETDTEDPHWRIIADATSGSAAIASAPRLPSTVSFADIGIAGTTTAIPLYVRMQTARAWSVQGMNQTSPEYAYAGGGSYVGLSLSDF